VVAVEHDRREREAAAPDLECVRFGGDRRAHRAHRVDEGDVALDRVAADAFDPERPSGRGDRAGSDEVRRRRRVAFDDEAPRRDEARGRCDLKALPAIARDRHAEALEQAQGDVDVRLRDQLACHFNGRSARPGTQRQREQERGQELARNIAAHGDRPVERERGRRRANHKRWKAGPLEVLDRATERAQRVDQIADRPLVHARRSAQLEARGAGGAERERGDKRAHRRSCIAEPENCLLGERPRADAVDDERLRAALDATAELLERLEHHLGVVGVEQALDRRRAGSEAGEQEGPVRDALRPRHAHLAADAGERRKVEEAGREHGAGCAFLNGACAGSRRSSASPRARRSRCG
jgi:hypothetical protein